MKGPGELSTVFARSPLRLFSIAAERPFLADLACALRASLTAEGAALSDALIYLPTRRAVRALTDAFVETAPDARASLLPRIRAIGDIDEDEFTIFRGAAPDELDLPPAVSLMERRLALAGLVAARDRVFDGHERWAGALAAGDELGRLLDSFYTEEVSPEALATLVPDNLAEHWRRSLNFLEIVTAAWPAYLMERGLMDPAERRMKLIDRQREAWQKNPPAHPVVIAGTTGSAPAVARLMKTAAALPLGAVVLPGLNLSSSDRFWETIDAPHPQSGLKQLLTELDAARRDVIIWPCKEETFSSSRSEIISVALCPADASDSWRDWAAAIEKDRGGLETALSHVSLVEAADEEREAAAIALKIREALETPEKTVILATPDRDLARRVAARLRRWNVTVDDSAGVPFANSPCGTFLRLVARWLIDPSDAVALMAVMRHPLFGGGLDERTRNSAISAMDRALRGLRSNPGAEGLRAKIGESERRNEKAAPLLAALEAALSSWPENGAFAARFAAHLEIAETLAATSEIKGAKRLWRGEDGDAGAAGLAPLRNAVTGVAHDQPENYPDIFDQLIAGVVVRRSAPAHPRIAILGPLEARLQYADLVILGGLNEGVWPRDAAIDPFLSRPMRRDLKLPSPEQRIGLSAHDFAQLAAAPEVMLTRAERAAGKPTKPSRWIVRLKNILKGAKALELIDRTHQFDVLARRLDEPANRVKIPAPAPRPPVDARPAEFFVTRIEKLMRDPYAIYARQILGIEKLDAHNEALDARHIGNLFHKVLEEYAREDLPGSHDERVDRLRALFERNAPGFGLNDTHLPFWRARADEAFDWLAAWDAQQREGGTAAVIEGKGVWTFNLDGREFTLGAKADRIDRLKDGSVFITDYKTGAPPPTDKQQKKFSPQLPLTGLIAMRGGFETLGPVSVSGFNYVRIIGRKDDKRDTTGAEGEDCAEKVTEAEAGLHALLRHFSDPSTPYPSQPRPQYSDDFGDYDHLARRRERNVQGGDE